MPIARWICQACGGREVPLHHFQSTACGAKVHPDYAAAVYMQESKQAERTGVRVTHGLSCPRREAIKAVEDYAVDPLNSNAALTGTAWHAEMERASLDPENTEQLVSGEIDGIQISGKVDRIRDGVIEDWKHVSADDFKSVETIKPEHLAQLSIYASFLGLTRLRVWYHSSRNGKYAFRPLEADALPLDEALAVKPYGGEFTVLELYQQSARAQARVKWETLPMAGASMTFGRYTLCDFCEVRSICKGREF